MKSIDFPEVTNKIAEHQKEYNTLFAQWQPKEQSINVCFELTEEEIAEIQKTGKIWYKQLTFKNPMHPMRLSPFKENIIKINGDG